MPMSQHIGAACEPLVKPKQEVGFCEKIGEATAPIAAPIHASVAATAGVGTSRSLSV